MIDRRDFVKASTATVAAVAVSGGAVVALADAAGYVPGTYTATGAGIGTVSVELTFDESSITEAAVDVSGETPWVGGQLGAQRRQQPGGHGVVAVQKQHPLALGVL